MATALVSGRRACCETLGLTPIFGAADMDEGAGRQNRVSGNMTAFTKWLRCFLAHSQITPNDVDRMHG